MGFQRKALWISLAAAWVLAACGGGGADTEPLAPVKTIKGMGDSLADSGTFGLKFTVQGAAPTGAGSTPIWPERVASSYGATLCPRYVFTGTAFNNAAGCTSYAVGGGRINNFTAPTSPVSITKQISDAGADGFSASDLLLIDGGRGQVSAVKQALWEPIFRPPRTAAPATARSSRRCCHRLPWTPRWLGVPPAWPRWAVPT